MIIFLAIVLTIMGLIHWFLYARLVSALEITNPALLWPLRILAVFLAVSYFIAHMTERHGPEPLTHAIHWIASNWLGLMWAFLWITLILYLGKIFLIATGVWFKFDAATITAIGRWTAYGTIAVAILLCGYGMKMAYGPARIANVRVPIKHITPELRELKIAAASDFHSGVLVNRRLIERMAGQIMSLKPDLILLPGDLVDRSADNLMGMADAFHKLQAPFGVYGTTGNHDYYVGLKGALEFLRAAEIRMLMNETIELPNGLVIAGIEDRTAKQFKLPRPTPKALLNPVAADKPTIFLNHTPDAKEAEEAIAAGVDLVLCGHSHAGQIWPFSILSGMAHKYHWGLYRFGKGSVFTSCGIGFWGPPMRIGAPPEIVLIRLVGENEPAAVEWTK
ncbi:metallophosphoesterase [candidate division KSB1 bacterium]|nr:MAG: metallophosphoesterase [candidate division KSB1 bacterium]